MNLLKQGTRISGSYPTLFKSLCKNPKTPRSRTQQKWLSTEATKPITVEHIRERTLLRLQGSDTSVFLQGLITNDVRYLESYFQKNSMYAMMLNVQGRVLYDLILYNMTKEGEETTVLMECDRIVSKELLQTLKKYKIKKKVDIAEVGEEYKLWSAFPRSDNVVPIECTDDAVTYSADPRLPALGHRVILPSDVQAVDAVKNSELSSSDTAYKERLYRFGVGEGVLDLPTGQALPLESNATFLNGVSFNKGCYVGQELTARTHHTGVTRKRLMPIVLESDFCNAFPGNIVQNNAHKDAGKYRNSIHKYGLALLRIADVVNKGPLTIVNEQEGGSRVLNVVTHIPNWWPTDDKIVRQVLGLDKNEKAK